MPSHKVKILLTAITRAQFGDYVGRTLYRLSGPVKIVDVKPSVMTYQLSEGERFQSFKGEGFYKPIARLIEPWADQDDLFKEIRPSNYLYLDEFLPRKVEGGIILIGANALVYSKIIKMQIDEYENTLYLFRT